MVRRVGKKGIFFTATAVIMVGIFMSSFFVYSSYKESSRRVSIESRVKSMNYFMDDVQDDIKRGIYIMGFRGILSLIESINIEGEYIDDYQLRFSEAFFNGTVKNRSMLIMQGNTFYEWEEDIVSKANETGIDILIVEPIVYLEQNSPWNVDVIMNFSLVVGDSKGTAYWQRNESISSTVSIINFEDPLYRMGTNGLLPNPIRKKRVEYFVGPGNDTSNLLNHTIEGRYVEFSGAPGFLKRLEGDFSSDENGIESLVDIDKLDAQGLSVYDKSVVDYIYFSGSSPGHSSITGMPLWFGLDSEYNMYSNMTHLELYSVEGLLE